MIWEVCICALEAFRMQKSSGIFKLYFVKKSIYDNLMICLFSEDENSTRQTRRVIYDFHLPSSFDTHISKWASAKGKTCW